MSKNLKTVNPIKLSKLLEVKSKFAAEFRRFSIQREQWKAETLENFRCMVESIHHLPESSGFVLAYTDPRDGDLLPLNNDDNFRKALQIQHTLLRISIQRRGECFDALSNGANTKLGSILSPFGGSQQKNKLQISYPQDFRQVAAIIDVDQVPEVCRRVRLLKHGSDKPLGFYIRDGTSVRVTQQGLERVPGIFISRLVPGGLAESTGLLAVNDEVLEVNGIEVNGKSLDQVTDMMVANSSNLIITVKPANQQTVGNQHTAHPNRNSFSRTSGVSSVSSQLSHNSRVSNGSNVVSDDNDDDEIKNHTESDSTTTNNNASLRSSGGGASNNNDSGGGVLHL